MSLNGFAFARGYQEALSDVKKEWDQVGPEAALAWINANLRPTDERLTARPGDAR